MLVIDDQILFRVLTGTAPAQLTEGVVVTFSWYFRLARAIAANEGGALSREFRNLSLAAQAGLTDDLDRLPPHIATIDPRIVVPLMASIATVAPSNFLTLEAIATAIAVDGAVITATATPLLKRVADQLHVPIQVL